MHIIFGESVKLLPDSYTVLELDTVRRPPDMLPVTAYCLVDKIPLAEFPQAAHYRELHQDLVKYYKQQHWDYCEKVITETLYGKWDGALDTFYDNLLERIRKYKQTPPKGDWDGTLELGK